MTHTTDIRLDLSRGHWALGEFEEAVIALERRALEGPLDETVLELANRFLDDLGGANAEGSLADRLRRLVEQASPEVLDPLDALPSPTLTTATMAEVLAGQGHSDQALEIAKDVLRRNPDDSRAKTLEGNLSGGPDVDHALIAELERWLANATRRAGRSQAGS